MVDVSHWQEVDLEEWSLKWPHFSPRELACNCCGALKVSEHLMDELEYLRLKVNAPLPISSGYRCPAYNDRISNTGVEGPHTTGEAVDIACFGEIAFRVVAEGSRDFTRVGISQKGEMNKRFIHLDFLKTNWIWSY